MSARASLYDEHLEHYEGAQRAALARTIEVARAALPGAVEVMAWGMPTFRAGSDDGPNVLSVTGFTRHNSLFPHSGSLSTALAEGDVDRVGELGTDPAGCPAGGAAAEIALLQQQHILHPGLRQVEGDARPHSTAADDDDAG